MPRAEYEQHMRVVVARVKPMETTEAVPQPVVCAGPTYSTRNAATGSTRAAPLRPHPTASRQIPLPRALSLGPVRAQASETRR